MAGGTTRHFAEELDELTQRLLVMAGMAEERVNTAMRGLVDRDCELIQDVITGDQALNALHLEIDDRCFKLLALQQPMASDLRMIVSTVKINGDLERVGDLAVNIAEAAERYIAHPPVKTLIDLPRMGELAQRMLRDAIDAFVSHRREAALEVLAHDDVLDSLKDQIFRELLSHMLSDPGTIEPGLDLILISRHLERIGDHATNIAEDVIFIVDALDIRHHAVDPASAPEPLAGPHSVAMPPDGR
jgi:phosphate transport system protein